ncbi:hypothetical protein HYH03_012723 [Edaphochlamys debaryana]|uniref:P/Homo B domain-containing protein n=1 Tax=Edaphochlamys debaryana TaxID=47281 RepID=A0A835XTH8_9CHLO|nr:hypothetical protein HYH03_012723 [Edaphochlamys debaryana]|eukprot:KAG2488723.1 hypothetical protein HYH03_012723 [Edaphochlamys debaryana]
MASGGTIVFAAILLATFFHPARTQAPTALAAAAPATAPAPAAGVTAADVAPAADAPAGSCRPFAGPPAGPASAAAPLTSTITVPPEGAPSVGAVAVTGLGLRAARVGAIKLTLTAGEAPGPVVSVLLKDIRTGGPGADIAGASFSDEAPLPFPQDPSAAPFTGTWRPPQPMTDPLTALPSAAGRWTLKAEDLAPGRDNRTVAITGWTLVVCSVDDSTDEPEAGDGDGTEADGEPQEEAEADPGAEAEDGGEAETEAAAPMAATPGAAVAPVAPVDTSPAVTAADSAPVPDAASGPAAVDSMLFANVQPGEAVTLPAGAAAAVGTGLPSATITTAAAANATATAAAAANATGVVSGSGPLLQLLNRLNRPGLVPTASTPAIGTATTPTSAPAASTPTPAAAAAAASDEGLVRGLLSRLEALNATAVTTARPLASASADATAARPLARAGGAEWRLGNLTLGPDGDGLVSSFLSSLSDLLYAVADANASAAAVGGGLGARAADGPAATAASAAAAALAANVSAMAQSALFREAAPGLDHAGGGFVLDRARNTIDALGLGDRVRGAIKTYAEGLQAGAAAAASAHSRAAAGADLAGGLLRASAAAGADYVRGGVALQAELAAAQAEAYVAAVKAAQALLSSRLQAAAERVSGRLDALQAGVGALRSQLPGLGLRGSGASALDGLGSGVQGLREAAAGLRAGVSDGEMLTAFRGALGSSQLPAAGAASTTLFSAAAAAAHPAAQGPAFRDASGAHFGLSSDAFSAAADRLSAGFAALRMQLSNTIGLGNAPKVTAQAVERLTLAVRGLQSRLQGWADGEHLRAPLQRLSSSMEEFKRALV